MCGPSRAAAASRWREAAAAREGQERGAGAAPASAPEPPVGGARERGKKFAQVLLYDTAVKCEQSMFFIDDHRGPRSACIDWALQLAVGAVKSFSVLLLAVHGSTISFWLLPLQCSLSVLRRVLCWSMRRFVYFF